MRVADDGESTARPTNWWILGLSADPAPGDPFPASLLSSQMSGVADGAYESRRGVQSLMGDPAITGWVGASGDAFRAACEPFPGQLATMYDSYQGAADALNAFGAGKDAWTLLLGMESDGSQMFLTVDSGCVHVSSDPKTS